MNQIVALSGPVGAGKSTLAQGLVDRFGFARIHTRELLVERTSPDAGRRELQEAGARLDRDTGGRWVVEELERHVRALPEGASIVVDAVRIQEQIEGLYGAYGHRVTHVHLWASDDILDGRYAERSAHEQGELPSYEEVRVDETEANVAGLALSADVVIDTARSTAADVLVRAASRLKLYGDASPRLVDVLVGGQYGSEGKGNISYYLAREYDVLVRVGGPNAGHKIMDWTGTPYTHHSLPSGSRVNSSAQLVIGPGATLKLEGILREIAECSIDYRRLAIDPQAMVITEEDVARETRLVKSIGSTGQGGGAAAARRILDRVVGNVRLARDYPDLAPYMRSSASVFEEAYSRGMRIFLEGTQGTELSLFHGMYPYVTSRDTTVAGCLAEAGIAPSAVRRVILVCRSYPIRVENPQGGTSGPMSQEIDWGVVAERSGLDATSLREAERTSTTNKRRRVSEFDWALLKRSAQLNRPTDIALTFVDYLNRANSEARRFDQLDTTTIRFVDEVEAVAQAPVTLLSTRFHSRSVIDRRSW